MVKKINDAQRPHPKNSSNTTHSAPLYLLLEMLH